MKFALETNLFCLLLLLNLCMRPPVQIGHDFVVLTLTCIVKPRCAARPRRDEDPEFKECFFRVALWITSAVLAR